MKTQLAIATITAFLGGAWAAEKPASELKPAPPPLQAQKIELSDDSGSISVTTTSSGGGTMVVSTSGKTVITENGKTRVLTLKDGKWVEEAPAAVGKADTAGTAPVRLDPPPAITGTGTITGLGPLPELKTGSPTAIRPPSPDALENRLKKARLLETRADGVKVYEDADGTRIYKGENSLMVVSGGALVVAGIAWAVGTVDIDNGPGVIERDATVYSYTGNHAGVIQDFIAAHPVPEPHSITLIIAAAGMLLIRRRACRSGPVG